MTGMAYTDWSWASLIVDLNNDGLKDILVSNGIKKDIDNNDYRNKVVKQSKNATAEILFKLSQETPSQAISNYAFENLGDYKFQKVVKDWGFDTPSFSNGMAYADLDNDGDLDIISNNIDAPAFVYKNNATGNFLKIKLKGDKQNLFGIGAKAIIYHNGKKQVADNNVTEVFFRRLKIIYFLA